MPIPVWPRPTQFGPGLGIDEGQITLYADSMRTPILMAMMMALLVAAGCQTHSSNEQGPSSGATIDMPEPTKAERLPRVSPFLMFQDGRAEEAINRYIEVFGAGRIISMQRYGENLVGAPVGSIQHAVFEIHGQRIGVTESPARHPFDFTPAISLFVDFDSEEELDRVFAALSEGGFVMMPLDDYGFSRKFAFLQDRFGVSWQLNLPSE